jgi:hypothetical protein
MFESVTQHSAVLIKVIACPTIASLPPSIFGFNSPHMSFQTKYLHIQCAFARGVALMSAAGAETARACHLQARTRE